MNLMDGVTLGESLWVTIFSMSIVFGTLVIISFILYSFKTFFYKEDKEHKNLEEVKKQSPKIEDNSESNVQGIDQNSDEEIVAVIAAAIAAAIAAQTGKSINDINIRNIKRVSQSSPAWANAGRQEKIYNNLSQRR